jgi:hypothetical protein
MPGLHISHRLISVVLHMAFVNVTRCFQPSMMDTSATYIVSQTVCCLSVDINCNANSLLLIVWALSSRPGITTRTPQSPHNQNAAHKPGDLSYQKDMMP